MVEVNTYIEGVLEPTHAMQAGPAIFNKNYEKQSVFGEEADPWVAFLQPKWRKKTKQGEDDHVAQERDNVGTLPRRRLDRVLPDP